MQCQLQQQQWDPLRENFISSLVACAQNGYAREANPFVGLCREVWGDEQLFDALKDLPHGPLLRTRLMYAAKQNDDARVQWLLTRGARANLGDKAGWTAMHYACHHGAVQSILALLRPRCTLAKVADVNARTLIGETALHFASANNFSHIVRLLLEAGADVNAQSSNGQTPLHFAASAGATASMRTLLDMGASIDSGEIDFLTPLHLASLHGRTEACRMLIEGGARVEGLEAAHLNYAAPSIMFPYCEEYAAERPLAAACSGNFADIVRLLVDAGAKIWVAPHESTCSPLIVAAYGGHASIVRILLETDNQSRKRKRTMSTPGFRDGFRDGYGDGFRDGFRDAWGSAFHYACKQGHRDVVNILLHMCAINVDEPNSEGCSPLHLVLQGNGEERACMIEELLGAGARTSMGLFNAEGHSPIHAASTSDDFNMALFALLESPHAQLDAGNERGETALFVASQCGAIENVHDLVLRGADLDAVNHEGTTALAAASLQGYAHIVRVLLSAGADISIENDSGETPLSYAQAAGWQDVLSALYEHGAEEAIDEEEGYSMDESHSECEYAESDSEGSEYIYIFDGDRDT